MSRRSSVWRASTSKSASAWRAGRSAPIAIAAISGTPARGPRRRRPRATAPPTCVCRSSAGRRSHSRRTATCSTNACHPSGVRRRARWVGGDNPLRVPAAREIVFAAVMTARAAPSVPRTSRANPASGACRPAAPCTSVRLEGQTRIDQRGWYGLGRWNRAEKRNVRGSTPVRPSAGACVLGDLCHSASSADLAFRAPLRWQQTSSPSLGCFRRERAHT
jgi:hypothetical protein